MRFEGHTHFVTVGQEVGRPGCSVPTLGRNWIPTLPPVVLELWPAVRGGSEGAFTTVANWRSYGSIEHDGVHHGQKAHSLRRLVELPRRSTRAIRAGVVDPPGRALRPEAPRESRLASPRFRACGRHHDRLSRVHPGVTRGDRRRQVGLYRVSLWLVQRPKRLLSGLGSAGRRRGHRLLAHAADRQRLARVHDARRRRGRDRGRPRRLSPPLSRREAPRRGAPRLRPRPRRACSNRWVSHEPSAARLQPVPEVLGELHRPEVPRAPGTGVGRRTSPATGATTSSGRCSTRSSRATSSSRTSTSSRTSQKPLASFSPTSSISSSATSRAAGWTHRASSGVASWRACAATTSTRSASTTPTTTRSSGPGSTRCTSSRPGCWFAPGSADARRRCRTSPFRLPSTPRGSTAKAAATRASRGHEGGLCAFSALAGCTG